MAHWMCTTCGYYLQTSAPPNRCPSCEQACAFNNVTCYRPGCEEQADPVLMGETLRVLKGGPRPAAEPKPSLPSSEELRTVDFLNGLDEQQRKQFRSLGSVENYESGAVIFTQGEDARKFYLLERGQVAVTSEITERVRFPIRMISPGYAFGWSALVPPHRYTTTASVPVKASLLAFEREALLSTMRANAALGLALMQHVAATVGSRLRTLQLTLAGLLQKG